MCVKDLFMFLIIIKLKMKREGGLKKKKDAVQGLPKGQNIGDYWRMNPKKYYLK